jgi:hypothetical protein
MICLKNGNEIGGEQWKRSPACNCDNCKEFFRKLRTGEAKLIYTKTLSNHCITCGK